MDLVSCVRLDILEKPARETNLLYHGLRNIVCAQTTLSSPISAVALFTVNLHSFTESSSAVTK